MTQSNSDQQKPAAMSPSLRDELVEILVEDMPDPQAAEDAARLVLADKGELIYSDLIWNLTNLRYRADEAKELWQCVLSHRVAVSGSLGRDVGVRVAALDYFTNVQGKHARPRVIDPDILERLYRDTIIDPLTNVANRRHYRERLTAELTRAVRYNKPFVLAIFDLDNFKQINDTRGHSAGDRILRQTAQAMVACIRDADLVARWGGEEFVILMPETPKRGGLRVCERIREQVVADLRNDGVTISGGIAAFPENGKDEQTLFAYADRALYLAKSEGKNRICSRPRERRAFPRLDENLKVTLTPNPVDGNNLETETFNVGGGGIAFQYDVPLAIATEIRGEIEIGSRRPVFIGHVARVEEIALGLYEIGVEFIDISPDDRNLIMSCSS